jgi:fucose permease
VRGHAGNANEQQPTIFLTVPLAMLIENVVGKLVGHLLIKHLKFACVLAFAVVIAWLIRHYF